MADGIRVEGDADLLKLAAAYKNADKPIRAQISKALRDVGKPIAKDILREGAAGLPHRGGLAARVASGSAGVTQSLGGKTVSVALSLRGKGIKNLRAMDHGIVRHPVFGRDKWVSQSIRAGLFTEAFNKHKAEAGEAMERAIAQAANDIERQA